MLSFLAMGGYAAYVWPAYGITLAVLGGLFWQSRRFARKRAAELEVARDAMSALPGRPSRRLVARRVDGDAAEIPRGAPAAEG